MSREDQLADRWSAEPTAATRPCALKVAGEVDVAPTIAQLSGHMDERQRRGFRDKLERYVRKPERDLIVAVSGGDILGFLVVIEEAFPPEALSLSVVARLRPLASCTGLLVHSRHRRQGIGASLVRRGEQWATERGKAGLWLVTHRAASWYERHFGYEAVATVQVKGVAKTVMARRFTRCQQESEPVPPP